MSEKGPYEPSDKKRNNARRDGKVLKSQVLANAAGFSVACGVLHWSVGTGWLQDRMLLNYLWTEGVTAPLVGAELAAWRAAELALLPLVAAALVSTIVEALQIGIRFEWAIVRFRFERLSPGGFGARCFGGIGRSWELIVKLGFLSVFLFLFLQGLCEAACADIALGSLKTASEVVISWTWQSGAVIVFLGVVDYLLRRREYVRDLSMSHDEVRREAREDEGDPHVRSTRRSLHEQIVLGDLVRRVRRSKVVLVEPNV